MIFLLFNTALPANTLLNFEEEAKRQALIAEEAQQRFEWAQKMADPSPLDEYPSSHDCDVGFVCKNVLLHPEDGEENTPVFPEMVTVKFPKADWLAELDRRLTEKGFVSNQEIRRELHGKMDIYLSTGEKYEGTVILYRTADEEGRQLNIFGRKIGSQRTQIQTIEKIVDAVNTGAISPEILYAYPLQMCLLQIATGKIIDVNVLSHYFSMLINWITALDDSGQLTKAAKGLIQGIKMFNESSSPFLMDSLLPILQGKNTHLDIPILRSNHPETIKGIQAALDELTR